MLKNINDKENVKNVKKQLKKDNLIKLGELSIAGAVLAGLNVTNNTPKSVKAAISNGDIETNKDSKTLDTNALTRMMNENVSTSVNSADTAKNIVKQADVSNSTATDSAKQNAAAINSATKPAATTNVDNGGFDSSWGTLNVKDWQGHVDGDYYVLDKYTGDMNNIIVPNAADFKKAGVDIQGKQVGISADTTHSWFETGDPKSIAFSKTNGEKVKAIGSYWTSAFTGYYDRQGYYENKSHNLNKFDGSNLDVSNITNMSYMFGDSHLTDLSGLSNWDVSNVTDMSCMFSFNRISDLTPLKNWNVSNVINMNTMFGYNQIKDLTGLNNWKVDKVTDMQHMFNSNQISNLAPLTNWKVDNVTNMSNMFNHNKIQDLVPITNWKVDNVTDMNAMFMSNSVSDLTPLKSWNVSNVIDMSNMFSFNRISDLTPLKNWNVSNVINMNTMFGYNQIKDLTGLNNWKVDKVTDMQHMFNSNQISNLAPLTNWKVDKVTNMSSMFDYNQISDLTPLKNWNVSDVTNMSFMFGNNRIQDLAPLTNWKVDNVTDMRNMFNYNQISDLTPLNNWNVSNVTNMSNMFDSNHIDLLPLTNWKVDNVTDMSNMFSNNKIKDLAPLTNWKVDNVTNMSSMFNNNQIKDLVPLTNWNVNNITDMSSMFNNNQISNLTPLTNWNVSNVTDMSFMFDQNTIRKADFSKWNFSKIKKSNNRRDYTNLYKFISDNNRHAIINLGDNSTLPDWFMNTTVNGSTLPDWLTHGMGNNGKLPDWLTHGMGNTGSKGNANSNIFTDNHGGNIILTSNPKLLANPNNDFNYVVFDINGTKQKATTPVFINSTSDKILQDTENLQQQTINTFKSNHSNLNYRYFTPVQASYVKSNDRRQYNSQTGKWEDSYTDIPSTYDPSDPVDVLNAIIPVTRLKTIKFQFKDTTDNKLLDSDTQTLTEPNTDGAIDYSSVNSVIAKLQNAGYDTSNITTHEPDTFAKNWTDTISTPSNPSASDPYTVSTDSSTNITTIIYNVPHRIVKVTHDAPKLSTDTIDGTNKQYPEGLTKNDLNKDITRTITFKDENGKDLHDPITQTVHMYRNATLDAVTNAVSYSDWFSDDSFDNVKVPTVTGYTPDKTSIDAVQSLELGKDYNQAVVYTRNTEPASITYVDDTTGKQLKVDTASPKFGDTIKFATNPDDYIKQLKAAGYDLVSNNYQADAKASDNTDDNKFTVHVKEHQIKVTHDTPKSTDDTIEGTNQHYPKGLTKDDLNQTLTRTVTFKDENGKAMHDPVIQTVHATRDATVNAATGQVTYTDWTDDGSFDSIDIPKFDGYTADTDKIDKVDTPKVGTDYNKAVLYTRNDEDASITYIDDTTGKVLKNDQIKPKFGDTIKFSTDPADYIKQLEDMGYKLVSNDYKADATAKTDPAQNKFTVHVKQGLVEVTHDAPKTANDLIDGTTVHYPDNVGQDNLNHTTTRTIKFEDSDGNALHDPVVQSAHMYRDATVNAVTGETQYTPWTSDDSFATVKAPEIEGYTSFIKNVPALDKLTSIGDRGQKIIYNRAVENASIKYIDDTTGNVLKSENAMLPYKDEIKFNTADYIKQLQDKGYELVSNNFKDGTTASADPTKNVFEVHVKERNINVTHDAPKTTDDTIENSTQHYPKGASQDDLNKTVTRTVVLKDENGKDLHNPIVQKVQMHRDATVNAVTGDVTYTKWSNEGSFDEVKIPDIDGYTPNKTSIPAETPDSPSDEDANVTYTRNTEQASIKYVDNTTGKTLKTENATPKFGDTIQFTTNPADYIKQLQLQGYSIVSNNYKSDTKASSDASKNQFEVHVKQQSVKVTHDQPKSTTDAINNGTAKYYPAGVNKDDLNKTISRTIVLKDADGKTLHDPIVQKVEMHRDATVNVVTGEVQYTPWTTDGSFDDVPVPKIDGYTADKTQIDGVKNPNDGQTYDTSVVYTRNDEDVSITYIDDTTGKVLKNETAKPKYGDVIKFDTTPADYIKSLETQGYKVISNGYKDGATAQADPTKNKFTVHVQQRNIQVAHDDPKTTDDTISGTLKKYPKGVDKNSLNETISRTIVFKDENGKALHEPIVQKVHMHRDATVNAATGIVTYTPWTAEGSFDAVQVPSVDGYTADKTVIDKVENPQDGQDYNTSVVYSRNDEDASITYIDDTTGKVLKNEAAKPKFGDAITFKTTPSDYIKQLQSQGYELVSNDYDTNAKASTDPAQNKFTVHVKQRNIQVTHDDPKTPDDTIENTTQHYPKGVGQDDLNKSVTRTITIKDSDGKVLGKPIVQTVKMHRDAIVNATTGEVTYTDWSNEGSFDSVKVPDIDGYTPDKTEIAGVKNPKNDQTYDTNITYTRNDENASISYIDDTAGKVLKTDTAKLKYGDAIKFETDPADYIKQLQDKGYEVVSNNFKSDVTASTDPAKNEFTIHVKQRTLKVMHDNPKTTDDTVEGTTQQKGVDKDDLNKTISRTIVLKDSDGNAIGNPIVQTVHMYRDATINAVTGDIIYTDWDSDGSFDAVPVPKKDGYTADKTEIPAVKNPQVDQKYDTNVTYTRDSEKASITFVDDTTGQTIKTDTADLKYGDAIKFENAPRDYIKQLESQGYALVSNDYKSDAKASTNPDNNKFTVHVKEVSAKVTYDNPKSVTDLVDDTKVHYPAGVDKDDLNKTISRTIVLKDPDGKVVGKPIVQTVKAHRDTTVNVVTGKVTYTDWTNEGSFDSVPVPKVDGYTPDKTEIAGVKDPKVDQDYNTSIIYTRDDEDASITYVDDTTGNVLKNESVKPKFGDEIKFETAPSNYIDQLKKQGYDIVSNNFKDGTTASTDPTKNKFTVHVKHHLSKVERTKDVHENINYNVTDENGKTSSEIDKNSPVLHFTQSGVKDEVTGKTDWNGTLNSQTFTTINTAKKPGYKADVNTIPSKTITITNGNWNKNHDIDVTVSYKPEKETVKLVIKDGNGNVVKTITKTGNYGDGYDFSGTKAPKINGYTFVKASGNAQGKFGEDGNNVVLVYKKNIEGNKGNQNRENNGSNNHGNGNQNNHENNINNSNHSNNNTSKQGNQTNANTSSNDAEINVFKQNLAKQQDNTLPEMSEAKKDRALIGVGVASLLGLAGIAGVQINKRRHGKH